MEYKHYVVFALVRWQILVSLLLPLWLTSCSAQSTYYVTPTPDTPCPGEPCHTLSQYVADQHFSNLPVNSTMEFLPGNHTLETTISVTNLIWLTLHGDSFSFSEVTSRIVCTWPAGFVFTDTTEIHISSLAFISCGHNDSAAVNIISVEQSNISNCIFHSNVNADSYANGFRFGHNGGALYVHNSSVFLTVNKFQYNSAGNGGALYLDTSNSIITGNTFEYSYAEYGGTLYVQSGTLHLTRSTFHNSFARLNGGVLYLKSSILDLTWSIFQNNSAGRSGGAVFVDLSVLSVTFYNNLADTSGGALHVQSSTLNLTRNTSHSNLVDDQSGGALYVQSSTLNLTRNAFHNNLVKDQSGGALYVDSSTLTLIRNTFHSNSADRSGGALYAESSALTLIRNTFHNNSAAEHRGGIARGGALDVHSSALNLTRNIFNGNSAENSGGALYTNLSTLNLIRNTFQNNFNRGAFFKDSCTLNPIRNRFQSNFNSLYRGAVNPLYGGAVYINSSTLTLIRNTFHNNSAEHWDRIAKGGALYAHSSTLNLTNNTFNHNTALGEGGALYAHSSTLKLTNNTFNHNTALGEGGALYAHSSTLTLIRNTFQNNSVEDWYETDQGGALHARLSALTLTRNTFHSNTAQHKGGALSIASSTLSLTKNIFHNNTAYSSGGALYVYSSMLNLTTNTFHNNTALDGGGALYVYSSILNLTINTFHKNCAKFNSGGALSLLSSTLSLTWSLFQDNTADNGGALYASKSNTLNLTGCTFQSNSADESGGVLYVESSTLNLTNSTFQSNSAIVWGGALCISSSSLSLTRSTFQYNTADLCGGALYAKSSTFDQFTRNTFQNNSADYGGTLDIFSDQLHLCTCRYNLTDCAGTYSSKPVYPGGTLEVPVIAYGQWNGTATAVLAVKKTLNGDIMVNNYKNTPNIIYYNSCSPLKYTIHSRAIGTIHEITLYIGKSTCSPIHAKTLTVTVGILSCPPGFQLSQTQSKCICTERLQQFTNTCLIDYTTVLRAQDAGFWVGYDNKSQSLILHPHCPFDYCVSKETYLAVDDSDKQCNYNRSGLLCGRCGDNLSLALGSSHCLQCSNSYLSLLAAFAFAGIALVVLLLVLRLTVAAGTINGLIFYANVIAVNSAIFFQYQTTNIMTVFIAWLNLDLGIEICFYNGMNAYVKTWLEFAFPLYVWALVVMIIISSYYSGRVARLFGSNPIAVLATLFLLSYSKLLRTVFAVLSYTYLEYPNDSQNAVWLYDGNIRYLSGKHIPLFIAAMVCLIFLFLPYTMLLILGQWLQAKSELKIFSCISSPKIMPFLDAYHAPYTDKHRYWTGLMLLVRFVLFLIFAVNALGDPSINLLAIASTTVAILTLLAIYNTSIYKTRSLSLLETSFILNLIILAVATLYIRLTRGNQNAATFTSVGIAFATFTGIVIYHFVQQMKGTRLWRRLSLKLNSMANNMNSGPEDRPGSPLNLVFISGSAPTQTVVCIRNSELREPLLTSE